MLILTRRPGESIIIELPTGEQIEVAVLAVKGNSGADRHRCTGRYFDCSGGAAGEVAS